MFPLRGISRLRGKRFPPAREWGIVYFCVRTLIPPSSIPAPFSISRPPFPFPPPSSIPAKAGISSRHSGKFRASGNLTFRRLQGGKKNTSIPAKAGISAASAAFADRRYMFPLRGNFPPSREEIPAFAGMEEVGGGMEERGGEAKLASVPQCLVTAASILAMLASILVMLASVLAINSRRTTSVLA